MIRKIGEAGELEATFHFCEKWIESFLILYKLFY